MTRQLGFRLDTVIAYDPKTINLTHWNDNGTLRPRMEGIYPELVSAADLFKHLAWNALVNGVTDASSLDGYADLNRGDLTMRVLNSETDIEAADE